MGQEESPFFGCGHVYIYNAGPYLTKIICDPINSPYTHISDPSAKKDQPITNHLTSMDQLKNLAGGSGQSTQQPAAGGAAGAQKEDYLDKGKLFSLIPTSAQHSHITYEDIMY